MSNYSRHEAPWGEISFENDRNWYARLSADPAWNLKADYNEIREMACADPEYDLFDNFMPTGRPKHDIGRYVLSQGVKVPIIRSMSEWQSALRKGRAMLRSELRQDYSGLSGLLTSKVIDLGEVFPRDVNGTEDNSGNYVQYKNGEYGPARIVEGPVNLQPRLFSDFLANINIGEIGTPTIKEELESLLCNGLYDGTVNPAWLMRTIYWNHDWRTLAEDANSKGYSIPQADPTSAEVSRWRYMPGINIRIFRDPIIEGKYYIGGREAHHEWTVENGSNSPNLEAHDKSGYRGTPTPKTFEYELPTRDIIELYEKVRTLPYFDQRQAPMMEMQYGDDGKLYFLQYLKTGLLIDDPGEYKLSRGRNIVISNEVRGVTRQDGEKVRLYMDPQVLTKSMDQQAFLVGFNMSRGLGYAEQVASMVAKVVVTYMLSFKDNHFNSAPLYRPPVTIGLWDGVGELEKRLYEVESRQKRHNAWDDNREVEYIDTIVTSNGRQASIESDWELKTEKIN